MTTITGIHPYADKFPMLPESELEELAESIRANGLRSPIVLTPEGLILDGRNRHAACQRAGIEPDTVVYEGDDLAEYVIDCNVARRNMSTGARAMATALVLADDGRRDGGRWKRGSVDITESGNSTQTWRNSLNQAGTILDFKPDLAQAVVNGTLALDAAYQQANSIKQSAERDKIMERERRKREREEAASEAERLARIYADLTQEESKYIPLIDAGTMTHDAALAAQRADTRKAREAEAAERKNLEQKARDTCRALAWLASSVEHENTRAYVIRAFGECSGAVPELLREHFNPHTIRAIAQGLNRLAQELETQNA